MEPTSSVSKSGAVAASDRVVTGSPSSGLVAALAVVSGLATLLILVQAIFAGRGLFGHPGGLDTHAMIGNVTLLALVVLVVVAIVAAVRRAVSWGIVAAGVVLLILGIVQMSLGYSAHDSGNTSAGAWHIPLGVLITILTTGLTMYLAGGLAQRRSRA